LNSIHGIHHFFHTLYGPAPSGYMSIWTKQNKVTHWFEAGNTKKIASRCLELAPSYDVYFGLGLQPRKLSSRGRGKAADVIAIPGIWLDIDCQGGTHTATNLPTFEEARELLWEFPLTPSILLHSGGGLHVYWLLDQLWTFASDDERKQAAALVQKFQTAFIALAAGRGWKLDNTSDLARVLRVPSTWNRKGPEPVPVRLLELEPGRRYNQDEMAAAVDALAAKVPRKKNSFEYIEYFEDAEDKPDAGAILDRCAFLRHCRDDAATLPEPEWYMMLTVMARTDGGPELCHELSSSGYPGYSERETDTKIRHALGDTGPMTCERIRADFGTWCRGCRENVTSPVVLGGGEWWEPPVPFDDCDLPKFPTDIFPDWLRDFVEAEAEATQTPPDLAGMLVLSVCATALAKKINILLRLGWIEPLNIWTNTALKPGNRKSRVFADTIAPLEEYEEAERDRVAPEIEEAKTRRKILEQTLTRVQNEAAKAKGEKRDKLVKEALDLARDLAGMDIPTTPELVADDCSPEAVAKLLAEQNGRIAIMSPEGDIFDIMAGRYSNGVSNLGNFLKGHAGDTIRVKRINRPPEYVKAPALTMGLSPQPDVLRGLMEKPGFRGRGLLGRFLYALPTSPVGYRKIKPKGMSPEIRKNFHKGIKKLLTLPVGANEKKKPAAYTLRLSPEAEARFNRFEEWLEPRLRPFADLGGMTDWGAKLAGAVARIVGILHMAGNVDNTTPWSLPVVAQTVENAVKLAKLYLIPHAKAAYAEMGADPEIDATRYVLNWIQEKGVDRFTKKELHQEVRGQTRFRRVKDLEPALNTLIEHGFIREAVVRKTKPGRRPSPLYRVNPHTKYTQNTQNVNYEQMENSFEDFKDFKDATGPVEIGGDYDLDELPI